MTRLSLQIPTLVVLTINVQNNFYVTKGQIKVRSEPKFGDVTRKIGPLYFEGQ